MADPEIVNAIKGIRKDDIIIAFMGPTGSGKSYFIDLLTGKQGQRGQGAGNSLKSTTSQIQATRVKHPNYGDRIVLVDAPGFDDTTQSDQQILEMIGGWLQKTYEKDTKLSGIIYLHRITDSRMTGSPYKNLRMFGELCGDIAMGQVVLVSTMWEKVRHDVGVSRETELEAKFWKPLIEKNSKVSRLEKSVPEAAWAIVNQLIRDKEEREVVLLQEELVELGKKLYETGAGKTLYNSLLNRLGDQKESLKSLLAQGEKTSDPVLAKELKQEYEKINEQFQKTFDEMKKLKIPLGQRIKALFFAKKTRAKAVKV